MSRFNAPEEQGWILHITRRKLVLAFTGLVAVMITVFIVGLYIGKGQRIVETELSPAPPVVIEEPTNPKPRDIPIEPLPGAPQEEVTLDTSPALTPSGPESGSPTRPQPKPEKPNALPQPPKEPTPQSQGQFVIQIIATNQKAKALDLVKTLKSKGFPAYDETLPKGMFRVLVGPYATKEEARTSLRMMGPYLPQGVTPIVRSTTS